MSSASRSGTAAVTGVLMLVAVAAGYLGYRWFDKDGTPAPALTTAPPVLPTETTADALPRRKVIPETLPDFALADRDGKLRRLAEWRGRPLVVNFWATWCKPCRNEIPLLMRMRTAHAAQKLEVIGIAVDFREDVLAYANKARIDYPVLIGEEDGLAAVAAMGLETPAYPFTVFADRQQRIVGVKIGELHQDDLTMVLAVIERVDRGQVGLLEGRQEISAGFQAFATQRAQAEAGEKAGS